MGKVSQETHGDESPKFEMWNYRPGTGQAVEQIVVWVRNLVGFLWSGRERFSPLFLE